VVVAVLRALWTLPTRGGFGEAYKVWFTACACGVVAVVAFATGAWSWWGVGPAAGVAALGVILMAAMPTRMSLLVSLTAGLSALSVLFAAARGRLYREQVETEPR